MPSISVSIYDENNRPNGGFYFYSNDVKEVEEIHDLIHNSKVNSMTLKLCKNDFGNFRSHIVVRKNHFISSVVDVTTKQEVVDYIKTNYY